MTNHGSYYHAFQGDYVIVTTRTNSFLGVLEEDNHELLKLRPSLVNEPRIVSQGFDFRFLPTYRFESHKPTIINTMEVQAVQRTTKQHAKHILQSSRTLTKEAKKAGVKNE
jgi:hypothetical protein